MPKDRESIRIILVRTTALAFCVRRDEPDSAEVWVPKSQCDLVPPDAEDSDECWLMIPQWLLDKKDELK